MSISQNFPGEGPNLYLNPAGSKILDPRISFSRASTGTYVDDDGFIKVAPINSPRFDHNPTTGESLGLLVEEQRTNYVLANDNIRLLDVNGTITSQSWKKEDFGSSPYGDITLYPYSGLSPEGKYNATRMTITNQSAGGTCYLIKNQVHESGAILGATGTYTASIWIKSNTGSNQTVLAGLAQYSGAASGTTSTSWTVTPTWQRFSFTYNIVTIGNIRVMFVGGSGNSGLDVLIWGASIEPGRYVTSHIPTTPTFTSRASLATFYDSSGILQTAATNVARSNAFLPDSSGVFRSAGLLLESAATNILRYSQEFDNTGGWFTYGNLTHTANTTTAPDGTTTADTSVENANNAYHVTGQDIITTSNTTYTASCYVKPLNRTWFAINTIQNTFSYAISGFQLTGNGTASVVAVNGFTNVRASIEKVANGWYRCIMTYTTNTNTGGTNAVRIGPSDGYPTSISSDGGWSYQGTASLQALYLWGIQLETGSVATSYIVTGASSATRAADVSSSSAVTRSADVVTLPGTSNINNETGGTLVSLKAQNSSVIDETSLTINPTSLSSFKPISEILYYPSVLTSSTIRQMRGNTSYVTNGLVLHLDAGNTASYSGTGTTWTDLSGNGNNGTLVNGPTYNSANDGSIVFDGADDYINLPYTLLSGGGNFTINMWVKTTSTTGTVFGNYPSGGQGNLQIFYGSNLIGMWLGNNSTYMGTSPYSTTLPQFTANFTQLTVLRKNTSDTELYLNGVLAKTGSSSSSIGTTSSFRIATNSSGGERYTGTVSTVQVYNRALTLNEILQNFNALRGRYGI